MYGDEFLPIANRNRCNPLFRVHKSEWVMDKIGRKSDSIQIHEEQNKPRTPIHEREAKIRLIQQLQEKSSQKRR